MLTFSNIMTQLRMNKLLYHASNSYYHQILKEDVIRTGDK